METGDDLKLIGRISNITKLSNGEFVSLELIEDVISAPGVAQCMVAASSRRSFVVAIVVPVNASVCCSAEEQEQLYNCMLATAQHNGLRPYEIPSRMNVKFVSEKWSPENGCLNAAMKLDRRGVLRRYQKEIEEMLEAADSKPQLSPPAPAHVQLTVETLCDHLSRRVRGSVCGSDSVDDVKFLGQDSLAIMSLLHDIRSTFALPSLPPHHWFSSGTLSGFVSNIQRLNFSTSSGGMLETIPVQVTQDDEELLQSICIRRMQSFGAVLYSMAPVLLTGVTGFLGVHLLEELLKQSDSRPVYCIIRCGAAGAEGARERLVSTLHKYKVALSSSQMSAVRVLAGDVAQPRFGLGVEEYEALCEEVGCVYHNASEVNWLMTYSQLRASNVIGTLNAIQFAVSGRSKWLHYVSTLSTCKDALLLEKPPAGGYAQSKWVAERVVHKAALQGLHATVCRPGTIGPHTVTGACNVTDYATCFILSIAQNGIYLDSNNEFELSPVDCVARAVVAVAMHGMRALENPQVSISNDCVSSASSLSDKVPSASPKCANSPILSRNLSSNTVGLVATPRVLNRTNSASSALAADWQEKHCFNLSHCLPVLTNQGIGRLICKTLELPPRPVGHETFYRSQV
jgi:thioester reductase-like protein